MDMQAPARPARRELRLWPGIGIAATVLLGALRRPGSFPEGPRDCRPVGILAGAAGALLLLIWWLLFSLAPVAGAAGRRWACGRDRPATPRRGSSDPSIGTGAMGDALLHPGHPGRDHRVRRRAGRRTRRRPDGTRRLLWRGGGSPPAAGLALLRTGGFDGNFDHDFAWRWSPTPEERLLAEAARPSPAGRTTGRPGAAPAPARRQRASRRLRPPRARRRACRSAEPRRPRRPRPPQRPRPRRAAAADASRPSGPASAARDATASSAACGSTPTGRPRRRSSCGGGRSAPAGRRSPSHGDLLYTQEQRGDDEIVACYSVSTGEPVWRHRDAARFYESNGGAGPRGDADAQRRPRLRVRRDRHPERARRARPAPSSGRATRRPTPAREVPIWGFSSSPLVVDDLVIVAAVGHARAYDVATGKPRWVGPAQRRRLQLAAARDHRRRRRRSCC